MLKVHQCWICTMLDNSPKQWWTTLCSYHNIYFLHCFSPRLFSCFRQKKSLSALCFSVLQIKILHSFEWFFLACHRLSTRPQADVTSVLYCDMAITMNHFSLFFFFFKLTLQLEHDVTQVSLDVILAVWRQYQAQTAGGNSASHIQETPDKKTLVGLAVCEQSWRIWSSLNKGITVCLYNFITTRAKINIPMTFFST